MSLLRAVEIEEPASLVEGCAAVFARETPEFCLLEEVPRKLEMVACGGVLTAGLEVNRPRAVGRAAYCASSAN